MNEILSVQHVTKTIKSHTILDDISFSIHEKEILGMVGPNGAGKSTLMKCIATIYFPNQGNIQILGKDVIKEHEQAMKNLGISIEQPVLYPNLNGHEHFQLVAGYKKADKEKIKELEDFCGLHEKLKDKTRTYSMGMKQRMALSLALMNDPKLIILDEPTNGLDPQSIILLREQMKHIKEKGSSILISSHSLSEIENFADRIIFIDHGKLIKDVAIQEIMKNSLLYVFTVQDTTKAETIINTLTQCHVLNKKDHELTCRFDSEKAFSKVLSALACHVEIYNIRQQSSSLEMYYQTLYGDSYD